MKIPVIANGDIVDAASARSALDASGADGVMVGRAAQTRPWIVAQIAAGLAGRAFSPPSWRMQGALLVEQYDAMLAHYGADVGMRCARKHLGWRLSPAPGGDALRARLVRERDPARVRAAITSFFDDLEGQGASADLAAA